MDSLRGQFPDHEDPYETGYEAEDEDTGHEVPPLAIGQDERRMQVRAYNFWASMLGERTFPSIEDLQPETLDDFGPYSVLLDFSSGIEDPAIAFLGETLAEECGTQGPIRTLSDVPSRSLLSRITDHYLQIIANQAPIGFEAEFVNQRGSTIAYRGILLPYSSDNDTIDFIYGVINWKELADQQTADELLLQIDQALGVHEQPEPEEAEADDDESEALDAWADGPSDDSSVLDLKLTPDSPLDDYDLPEPCFATDQDAVAYHDEDSILELGAELEAVDENDDAGLPATYDNEGFIDETAGDESLGGGMTFLDDFDIGADLAVPVNPEDMALADWLASARELAEAASASEDRTRQALYAAIGRAYDFSLAAAQEPEDFVQLLDDAGLTMQDRAPMTPVVKLVFGVGYDKTRLTEFAAALTHAHRLGIERGALAEFLAQAPGGLKGIVNEERRLRRAEAGKPETAPRDEVRKSLAKKLRKLETRSFAEIPADGGEFTVVLARRMPDGQVVLLGEVANDISLIERAAKNVLG